MKKVFILIQISYADEESPRYVLGVYSSRESAEKAGREFFKKGGFYAWDVEEWGVED